MSFYSKEYKFAVDFCTNFSQGDPEYTFFCEFYIFLSPFSRVRMVLTSKLFSFLHCLYISLPFGGGVLVFVSVDRVQRAAPWRPEPLPSASFRDASVAGEQLRSSRGARLSWWCPGSRVPRGPVPTTPVLTGRQVWGHRPVGEPDPTAVGVQKPPLTGSGRESGRASFRLPRAPGHVGSAGPGVPLGFFRCGHRASSLQAPGPGQAARPCPS